MNECINEWKFKLYHVWTAIFRGWDLCKWTCWRDIQLCFTWIAWPEWQLLVIDDVRNYGRNILQWQENWDILRTFRSRQEQGWCGWFHRESLCPTGCSRAHWEEPRAVAPPFERTISASKRNHVISGCEYYRRKSVLKGNIIINLMYQKKHTNG